MKHLVGLFPNRPTPHSAASEQRASPEDPRYSLSSPEIYDALTGGVRANSGQSVNMQTALGFPAVLACVRVLAESVASLPLIVYERLADGGKKRAPDHPMYALLHDRPNEEHPSFVWREMLMGHLALRGNAFVAKEYDNRNRIIGLWPIRPDTVKVERRNGVKQFIATVNGVEQKPLTAEDVMHIPAFGYDGLVGYQPITLQREAIGLGLAAQEHAARYFENGAEPGGVLQHPTRLSNEAAKNLKESFQAKHGGTANAHKVFVAEEGMTWQSIGLSNRDLQFIENRKYQVSEIARIYRIPPHMVGDLEHATFSNIEQQGIEFVVHTLRPWLVRWEQVMNYELFADHGRKYFVEFNVDGLLRGDSAARGAFYNQMFQVGGLSINDILRSEGRNTVDGGDERFVPMNMVPLSRLDELVQAQIDKQKAPADPQGATKDDPPDDNPPADNSQRALVAFHPMVRNVLERALMRESVAAKRAAKKGKPALDAWLVEYQGDQAEFLVRELAPVALGAAAMLQVPHDAALVRNAAAGEIASHLAAYRLLEAPTEAVVHAMLERFAGSGLDATARSLTTQLIGALALTSTRRTAA